MTGQTERNQEIKTFSSGDFLAFVQECKLGGWRLGVMIANLVEETVEIIYVFEKENELKNGKLIVPAAAPVAPSITLLFGYAFVYENEIHDLFGVKFEGLQLDFGGNYFVTGEKNPWNPLAPKEEPPAETAQEAEADTEAEGVEPEDTGETAADRSDDAETEEGEQPAAEPAEDGEAVALEGSEAGETLTEEGGEG